MTMTIGKSFDTHGPLGPWLVTGDELGDPQALGIRTFVNDEQRQDGNTGEMVFDCFQQVSHLSEAFTLEPGDVIATGTPAGVGSTVQPFPSGFMKAGDTVRVEIDGIGELRNTVVEEPDGFLARGGLSCSPGSAKRMIARNMARAREGDIAPTLKMDAEDVRFRFPGDSSWAVELEGKDQLEPWLRRFADVGLQIYPDEVVLKGFPWNQTICVRGHDFLDSPQGERVYENRYVIWGRIAWANCASTRSMRTRRRARSSTST